MTLKKRVALLSLVAATGLFAGMSTVEGLIVQMNQTTDDMKKNQLMRKIDKELATMNKEDRAKAVALIKVNIEEPKKVQKKVMKGKEQG